MGLEKKTYTSNKNGSRSRLGVTHRSGKGLHFHRIANYGSGTVALDVEGIIRREISQFICRSYNLHLPFNTGMSHSVFGLAVTS